MASTASRTMSNAIDELGTKAFSNFGFQSIVVVLLCFVCKKECGERKITSILLVTPVCIPGNIPGRSETEHMQGKVI
jgi:hypothetical protein